jgi:hypothetical protein
MGNQPPDEDNVQESQYGKQQGKFDIMIDYALHEMGNHVQFLVSYQDPRVTEYLENHGMYYSSNGMSIVVDPGHSPEYVLSRGLIRLDGTGGEAYGRPDDTEFATNRPDIQRKAIAAINFAIKELADKVRLININTIKASPLPVYRHLV